MSDDRSKTGQEDRIRINVNQEHELRDWSAKFDVTPEELRAAVDKVGVMAKDVERELQSHSH
ncbi:MAG: DUF3606 domain-containing protein [Rhodanobacteraceae bacterium]